ncbi:hypothetical protein DERP_001866 [Dermatophagoides pteronyssinus]|uniref:Uncharacterized protein n=1 Tax=Dermatophagoides pteronyssinus TaxID=6956 RepID=A0ABQ8JC90_DERPT|nr:hypothetical protein DERP_001866 [Dermatophagoides pteronyssinus]
MIRIILSLEKTLYKKGQELTYRVEFSDQQKKKLANYTVATIYKIEQQQKKPYDSIMIIFDCLIDDNRFD